MINNPNIVINGEPVECIPAPTSYESPQICPTCKKEMELGIFDIFGYECSWACSYCQTFILTSKAEKVDVDCKITFDEE